MLDMTTAMFLRLANIQHHPAKMATLIPAMAMFVRGDIGRAQKQVVVPLPSQLASQGAPSKPSSSKVCGGPTGLALSSLE